MADPPQAGQAATSHTHLFLIHGAGCPAESRSGSPSVGAFPGLGLGPHTVHRIDWHPPVEAPDRLGFLAPGLAHLRRLLRGLVGASALHAPDHVGLAQYCYRILHVLLAVAPAVAFCTALFALGARYSPASPILYGCLAYATCLLVFAALPAVLLLRRGISGLLSGLRQGVLCLLWPLVYLTSLSLSWVGLLVASILLMGILAIGPFSPSTVEIATDRVPVVGTSKLATLLLMPLLLAPIALWAGLVNLLSRLLAWPSKLCADVVSFLGDPAHRARLIRQVREVVDSAKIQPGDRVLLVGHGLGAGVAVVYLLHDSARIPVGVRLHLVTMGCPWRGLLLRCFPGVIPTPEAVGRSLHGRSPNFRWVNVYRPFDPVGTSLFPVPCQATYLADRSTGQPHGVRTAHQGYWNDEVVVAAVREEVVRLEGMAGLSEPAVPVGLPGDLVPPLELNQRLARSRVFLGLVVALILLPIVWEGLWTSWVVQARLNAESSARLREAGFESPGSLFAFTEDIGVGEEGVPLPVTRYLVVFTPAGKIEEVAYRIPPAAVSKENDQELSQLLAQKGRIDKVRNRGWPWDTESRRAPVSVRYLPEDPTVFELPDHGIASTAGPWRSTLFRILVLVPFLLLVGILLVAGAPYTIGAYLGVESSFWQVWDDQRS